MNKNNKPSITDALRSMAAKTESQKQNDQKDFIGINPEQYSTSGWRKEIQGLTDFTGTQHIDRSDYDKHLNRVYNNYEIDKQRAKSQGFIGEFASAFGQLPFRIIGDGIAMLGIVPEALDGDLFQVLNGNAEVDFGNSLLDMGMGISDWAQEAMPIYKMDPGSTIGDQFTGGWDSAYWANILPEAVSTVADLLVSKGALSLIKATARQGTKKLTKNLISRQLKATRKSIATDIHEKMAMPGVSKAVKDELRESSKYVEDILSRTLRNESFKNGRDNLFAAYIGRHFEAGLEAAQLEEESKRMVEESSMKDIASSPAYKEFIRENGRTPSKMEYAKYVSSRAARRAYGLNMGNMIWDLAQLSSLGHILGKGSVYKVKTKSAEMLGKKLTKGQRLRYRATPFLRTGASGVTESIEEAWNFVATEEGKNLFRNLTIEDYETELSDRLRGYLKDEQLWESAFMGFMGSTIMTPALGRKAFVADTKDRLNALDNRKKILGLYVESIAQINERTDINDFAKKSLKSLTTRNFVSGIAIDAAANGNSQETKGFFNSPEYKQGLIDNQGFTEQEATDLVDDIVSTINEAERIFKNAKKFDFLGTALYGKNKDAKVQNEVINKKLMEKISSFNTDKEYQRYKEEVTKYLNEKYGDQPMQEEFYAEEKALTNLYQKYTARAMALSNRIQELTLKSEKKKLKSEEAQELVDLKRAQNDYNEMAQKFMTKAEVINKSSAIADGMAMEKGQTGQEQNRKKVTQDQTLIDLIEYREQYKVHSEFANEKSENEQLLDKQSKEDLEIKEQAAKELEEKIINEINEIGDPDNLEILLSHPSEKVKKAAEKRLAKIKKKAEVVRKSEEGKKSGGGIFNKLKTQSEQGVIGEETSTETPITQAEAIADIEKRRNEEENDSFRTRLVVSLVRAKNDAKLDPESTLKGLTEAEIEDIFKKELEILNLLITKLKEKGKSNKEIAKVVAARILSSKVLRFKSGFNNELEKELENFPEGGYKTSEEIHKKYDAELAALKEKTPTQGEPQKTPAQAAPKGGILNKLSVQNQDGGLEESNNEGQEPNLTPQQKETVSKLQAESDKVRKVKITFKKNKEGEFADEEGYDVLKNAPKVIVSAKLLSKEDEENAVEYDGYIVLEDSEYDSMLGKNLPKNVLPKLLDRATSFIDKPYNGSYRGEQKFAYRDKFLDKYKPSGKIGTRIDDLGREVLNYLTKFGNDNKSKGKLKNLMKKKYAVRGDKEMFSVKENVSQDVMDQTIDYLVDKFSDFYKEVITDGKYIVPSEIQVAGSAYAGTTDITVVDKQGRVEIYDMKTFRFKGEGIKNVNMGAKKIEGYKNQLFAYARAVERIPGMQVTKLGLLPISVNWNDAEDASDIKNKGLIAVPKNATDHKNATSVTNLEKGSTENVFLIKYEDPINEPDPDKGGNNPNQEKRETPSSTTTISTSNGFFFFSMKKVNDFEGRANAMIKHHNALRELDQAALNKNKRELNSLIKLEQTTANDGKNLAFKLFVDGVNVGGINFTPGSNLHNLAESIKNNNAKVEQLAADIKQSIVNSFLEDNGANSIGVQKRYKKITDTFKTIIQGKKLSIDEIRYLFKSMKFADAHSLNKNTSIKKPNGWSIDASNPEHTGSGAQMLFSIGDNLFSSFATIVHSVEGMGKLADLIQETFEKESESEASKEGRDRISSLLVDIFGTRTSKETNLPAYKVFINEDGDFKTYTLEDPNGRLIPVEEIAATLKEAFATPGGVKPIVLGRSFGVTKGKEDFLKETNEDVLRILFEYGQTNLADAFNKIHNIEIRTSVTIEQEGVKQDKKKTAKDPAEKTMTPKKDVPKKAGILGKLKDQKEYEENSEESTDKNQPKKIGKNNGKIGGLNGLGKFNVIPSSFEEGYDYENFETFRNWFKKNLPNIPIEVVENIISRTGVRAFGTFYNNAIKLAENAPLGTGYHEAYHFVHNSLLTGAERIEIIREAKKAYPAPNGQDLENLRKNYPYLSTDDLTDIYYEEQLAEAFRKYKITQDGNDVKTSKIRAIFDKIIEFLKSFVSREDNRRINRLFKKIDSGNFKNSPIAPTARNVMLNRALDSFNGSNRSQEEFANATTNYVYNNIKDISNKSNAEIVRDYFMQDDDNKFLVENYNPNDPKDATKLVLIGQLYNKSFDVSEEDGETIRGLIANDFDRFFDIVESKLANYYGVTYTKSSTIRETDNKDTEVHENNDEDLVQKDWADETSLNEKPSKSMSRALKRLMRNSPMLTSTMINDEYIVDIIDDITNNRERNDFNSMEELNEYIQANHTEKTLGLNNNINFIRVNKYLERNLANISTKEEMLSVLMDAGKMFRDVASVYFSIMNSDNTQIWFEHFRKNAYTMVSSQKIEPNQPAAKATYIANRESGSLEVSKIISRKINRNFEKIKNYVLENFYDGNKFNADNDGIVKFLNKELFFNQEIYGDQYGDYDYFKMAMGAISTDLNDLSLPFNKKADIINIGKEIAKIIATSEKGDDMFTGYLDDITEILSFYQWNTNSNFRVGNKGRYGIAKSNLLSERVDEINNINSSNRNVREKAAKDLDNMQKDPHIRNSNWEDVFYTKGAGGNVIPIAGFLGIRSGVFGDFNGIPYANLTDNDFDHMNFAEFLSPFKRGTNRFFYNQLLPTQSDSTTPYFVSVPFFESDELMPAFKKMVIQELDRIKTLVEGLNSGKIHRGNLPSIAINPTGVIDPQESPIFRVDSLPFFNELFPNVDGFDAYYSSNKQEWHVAPVDNDQIDEALKVYLGKLREKIENEFDQKIHMSENSNFGQSYGSNSNTNADLKKRWVLFSLNYIINANEMQNFFTGKSYEFKNAEDKSKRGKNPSANGVVSQPSNPLKVKKYDKNGKVYYEEKKNSNGEVIINTVDVITFEDVNGSLDQETKNIIAQRTKEMFGQEQANRVVEQYSKYDKGDAGSYMTWQRFEQLQRNRGKVHNGSKLDKLFNKLRDGKPLEEKDYKELSGIIAVEKPYLGDRRINPETGLMESHMLKFGITVLFPDLIRGTKLEKIAEYMETEGIAEAHFGSAQKIGKGMILDVNEFHEKDGLDFKEYAEQKRFEAIEKVKRSNPNANIPADYNPFLTNIDLTKYRIQLENPDHTVDTDNLLGTQAAKLIFSNLSSEKDYKLYNPNTGEFEEKTGQEVLDFYATNYATDVSLQLDELMKEIGGEIQVIDRETNEYRIVVKDNKKLAAILKKELDSKDETPEAVKEFLALREDGEFEIPLNFAPRKNDFQSIILSMFTKRINKLRMPGYSGAQVSSVFFENTNSKEQNGVEWAKEKRGNKVLLGERINPETGEILPAEILVKRTQSWMNGKTIEEISKIPGALESIGYRIPTEAKSSMVRVKIVGFLSDATKATIVVPDSLVPKMGSDFDIDKLFFMQRKYGQNKNGKVFRHTLEKGRTAKDRSYGRKNNIYDAFDAILSSQAHYVELMSPQGFEDLKKAAVNTVGKKEGANPNLNHNLYEANKEFRKRNMDGKQTLGIAASANPTNSVFQILGTELIDPDKKSPFEVSVKGTDGKLRSLKKLSNYKDYKNYFENAYVTMQSAQGVGASADAAKEPTTTFIGLNPGNFATYQAMIMLGIPIMEAYYLTRQPAFDYYGRVKSRSDVYSTTKEQSESKERKLISALLDAKGITFDSKSAKNKEITRLLKLSKKEAVENIDFSSLKDYDYKNFNIEEQVKLLNQIKVLEKVGNHISQFTSATKPEGFGSGKDAFATQLKMVEVATNRNKSLVQNSYDKMYPNTNFRSTSIAGRNISNSNLTDVEIFDYFYTINQDNITKKDC